MKSRFLLCGLLLLLFLRAPVPSLEGEHLSSGLQSTVREEGRQRAYHNRPPLPATSMYPLPLTSIRPRGWLQRQLRIQADGLSGHLDELWSEVGPSSAWLGGTGEAWERGPYFLDGLVPLAYLLDDPKLKAKAQRWVNWTLTHQGPDGSIGPVVNQDWWPRMIMLKAMTQYQEATGDPRVIPLMQRYFAFQAWVTQATVVVDGVPVPNVHSGSYLVISREWKPGDRVEAKLPMPPRLSHWENNSIAIERGPLVFSLKIGESWSKLDEDALAPDWEVRPTTPWNYGLVVDAAHPATSIKVIEAPIGP